MTDGSAGGTYAVGLFATQLEGEEASSSWSMVTASANGTTM